MARLNGTLSLKSKGRPIAGTAPSSCDPDYTTADDSALRRSVVVERDGDAFIVRVEPSCLGGLLDRSFAEYKRARGYAGGLRLMHRWPIEDCAAGGAK